MSTGRAYRDDVKESWTGEGTIDVVLEGAVAGFEAWGAADDGLSVGYRITHQGVGFVENEVGAGVYTHSTRTLTRVTIYKSTAAGAKVGFSAGVKHVAWVELAADLAAFDAKPDTVFGRTGAVVAASGDYAASLVTNDSGVTGADVAAALDTLDAATNAAAYDHVVDSGTYGVGTEFVPGTDGAAKNELRQFTAAGTIEIQFPSTLAVDSYGTFEADAGVTLNVTAGAGATVNGGAGPIQVSAGGAVSWWTTSQGVVRLRGDTDEAVSFAGAVTFDADVNMSTSGRFDGGSTIIQNYRQRKYEVGVATTLTSTNYQEGSTLAHTGAAVDYTVPSRLLAGDTGKTDSLVIHNRGSGAVTLVASGVTIKGDTSIAIDASATLEWDHDGTTEYVWARSTG